MSQDQTLELLGCPPSGKAVDRMTPKGRSPVDLESAETATSRRSLFGAVGVAGLASAAALAVARPAAAAPPYPTTASDRELLGKAQQLELAAKMLYRDAVSSGLDGASLAVAQTFGDNHEAYADQMAASTGISADTVDQQAYDARKDAFSTGDVVEFATAAWELENSAAATYTDLFNDFESIDAQTLISSMIVVNGRMATVLADLAGITNASEVLEPNAQTIAFAGGEDE